LVACVTEIFRYVIMVVTSFDPEVNGLISISNLPKSVLVYSELFLTLAIINKHVSFSILTIINADYQLSLGTFKVMRSLISNGAIVVH